MTDPTRIRRAPPPWRHGTVADTVALTPHMQRVTLTGPDLVGLPRPEPAASVRLLLPGATGLVVPTWNGNEFLLPDGRRPLLRTLTPVAVDPEAGSVVVDVVRHGAGAASTWASAARAGDPVAVSGPGRGWSPPAGADTFVVVGDESAVPAIRQVLAALPPGATADVRIEVAHRAARQPVTDRGFAETWTGRTDAPGTAMVAEVESVLATVADPAAAVWWVAGEAAAVQRIRVRLFHDLGVPRARASVRGYWKRGTVGTDA